MSGVHKIDSLSLTAIMKTFNQKSYIYKEIFYEQTLRTG